MIDEREPDERITSAEARRLLAVAADDSDRPRPDAIWSKLQLARIRRSRARTTTVLCCIAGGSLLVALGLADHLDGSARPARAQPGSGTTNPATVTVIRTVDAPVSPATAAALTSNLASPNLRSVTVTDTIIRTTTATVRATVRSTTSVFVTVAVTSPTHQQAR